MVNRFGNYRGLKVNPITSELKIDQWPTGFNDKIGLIAHKYAISFRDELITLWLKKLNVNYLLDVGCDFGSLLSRAAESGIASIGVDVDEESLQLARKIGLNVRSYSIEQILSDGEIAHFFPSRNRCLTAVSCLNIMHGNWEDTREREKLLSIFLNDADFVIVTLTSCQLRRLQKRVRFQIVAFLGETNRPLSRWRSQIRQYGLTFFFKGRFHLLEKAFWELILGQYRNPNPVNTYIGLVVVLSRNHSNNL